MALAILFAVGCGGDDPIAQLPDGPDIKRDSLAMPDTGSAPDGLAADAAMLDSSGAADSGSSVDSTTADAMTPDSLAPDSSTPDSSTPDSSTPDSSTPDSSTPDSSTPDSGGSDAGVDAPGDGPPQIPACPVNTWCTEDSPIAGKLLGGVWAVDPNDVFVVGSSGTILRRLNNQPWVQMTSNTIADLAGVWAASSTDVWAVGRTGTIRRFDGSTWRAVSASTTMDFNAVWGSGPNDVWLVGPNAVVHWNGSQFASQALPGQLLGVSGTGPNDVWVTGESAFVHHFNGTWTTGIKPDGNVSTWFAIHAITATNVFAAGFSPNKETMQFGGAAWTARSCKLGNSSCIFQGFFSTSATNLWGAGGTKVGHWNGTAWTAEAPAGPTAQLWDVSGSGTHLWVVGSDSLILHRN